jgi:hypothetical protein
VETIRSGARKLPSKPADPVPVETVSGPARTAGTRGNGLPSKHFGPQTSKRPGRVPVETAVRRRNHFRYFGASGTRGNRGCGFHGYRTSRKSAFGFHGYLKGHPWKPLLPVHRGNGFHGYPPFAVETVFHGCPPDISKWVP